MNISMKISRNVKTLLLAFVLLISYGSYNSLIADHHENDDHKSDKMASKAMVIAVVNEASWCPACQENGKRIKTEVAPQYMKNKNVTLVINNLSDKMTIEESNKTLHNLGLDNFTDKNKSTGVIYFVNPKTKKVVDKISVTESTKAIMAAFEKNMSKM